ncbi:MAG: hypothetical protein JNM67_13325, partial [Bacteroidetes bacterium]|nr:hypothetical protein [Bacteroidota bacterium]
NYTYGQSEQPGEQPIRVLYREINIIIGKAIKAVEKDYPERLRDIEFNYNIGNEKISGPRASEKRITIDESFLSFLWTYCNGLITGPINLFPNMCPENHKAVQMLDYARDLFRGYRVWDKTNLPNPELHNKCISIRMTNTFFLVGVHLIICHEMGHYILGHTKKNPKTREESIVWEYEADNFAIRYTQILKETASTKTINTGMTVAICALTFAKKNLTGGARHPDPYDRISNLLESLALDETDLCWATAMWSYFEWISRVGKTKWPETIDPKNIKKSFYMVKALVDSVNREEQGT